MTKHIAVPDLKPCPFCGGEATVMEAVGDVWVKCCVCHSSNGVSTGDRKKAIDAWNARALLNGPGVEPVAVAAGQPTIHRDCNIIRVTQTVILWEGYEGERPASSFGISPGAPLYLAAPSAPVPEWPVLDKPALVGGGRFHAGVSARLVVEAAQRHYEYEVTPEKEAERIARSAKAIDALVAPVQAAPVAYHDKDQPEGIAWCPGYPEKLKDISPLYAQAPVQAVPDWQPIETAPKDDTAVLGYQLLPSGHWVIAPMYFKDGEWRLLMFHTDNTEYAMRPSHWMPLPQPPKESTAKSVACPTDKEKNQP